jgi:ATP-dependent DNA helicase RecG
LSKVIDEEVLTLIDYVDTHFELKPREITAFGIVARHKKILSTQLSKELQLAEEDRLRSWLGSLVERKVLITRGTGKGTSYLANPALLADAKLNVKPTLKTVQPHVLKQLIIEDLTINLFSSISQICERLQKQVLIEEIRPLVYKMVTEGVLNKNAPSKQGTVYFLAEKK